MNPIDHTPHRSDVSLAWAGSSLRVEHSKEEAEAILEDGKRRALAQLIMENAVEKIQNLGLVVRIRHSSCTYTLLHLSDLSYGKPSRRYMSMA